MGIKPGALRGAQVTRKPKHLCPKCSEPCMLYISNKGWKSRGVCPQGHDYPTASLSLETR